MKRITPIVAVALAAVVALVVAVSGGSAKQPAAAAATPPSSVVSTKATPVGKVLVDGAGHTLYLFQADRPNASTLSAAGLQVWPAFTASAKPRASGGVSATTLGTNSK